MSRLARLRGRLGVPAGDLAWLAVIAAVPLLAATFAWLTPQLAKLFPTAEVDVFSIWRGSVSPEPLEDVRGIVTLFTPFLIAAVVVALGEPRPTRRSLDLPIVAVQIVGGGLLVWSITQQPHHLPLVPSDYLHPLILGVPNLVAGVLIGLLLTVLVLRWPEEEPGWLERLRPLWRRGWLAFVLAAVAAAIFILPAVVTDSTVAQSGRFATPQILSHADDYFAAVDGRTPLVDYIGQYTSLLPLALEPVLAMFHSSLLSFSIAASILSAIALLAVFGVFAEVTRRPWVALALFVPFLAIALLPWHDQGAAREFNGNYFALMPDRLLGPFLLAFLVARSARGGVPPWVLFGVGALTVLNNAEFGVGAVIALVIAAAATYEDGRVLGRRVDSALIQAAAGLAAAVLIVVAVILIRTGELPDPALLTYFSRLFLRGSFGLIPMSSLGLHWALYATYVVALLLASVRFVRRDPDRALTTMLAYSGALGLVTGMYFVGRSAALQLMILFPIWGLCLGIVAWTAVLALRSARRDRARLRRVLLPAAAALVGVGVMVASIDRVSPPWRQIQRLSDGGSSALPDSPSAQRFVEANAQPGDRVVLIGTPMDHRVADRAGVDNLSPVAGYTSLITADVVDRALDRLEDDGGGEVFEAISAPSAVNPSLFKIPDFAAILRQRGYRLITQDPTSGLRLWRRTPAGAT